MTIEKHQPTTEALMLHMEDFDNAELDDWEWQEQLEDAVRTYNEQKGTSHHPTKSFNVYVSWKKDKAKPDM